MNVSKMLCLVENYYTNLAMLTELRTKQAEYSIKVTATYGLDGGGGGGFANSKVENQALKNFSQEDRITALEKQIQLVDEGIKVLDQEERQVIEKIKIHRRRVGVIARSLHKSSKYVITTRKRALKKMCEFVGGKK